jgi:UDP-glucuronate decarboxylase
MLDQIIHRHVDAILKQVDVDEFRSRRVTVTGGAGFLGSWLCDALISSDAFVNCIDNLSTGLMENVEHLLNASNFRLQNLDVTQPILKDDRYDLILHFASRASPQEYQQHPIETLAANSQGTQNMLELARKNDACLVYASTSEVYGDAQIIPTPESYWGNVNPIGPRSSYDEAKRFGEALCTAYHRTYGLDARIVRIFNTYGARLRFDGLYGRALSRFIDQALSGRDITVYGKGDQTRSFCYVTDTITAILHTATRKEMRGEVVNIGSPHEISILELAQKIKTLTNSESKITFHPRPPDDPQRRCPDISKAKKLLGWSPTVTLEEGLRKTIHWFRHRREAG